MHKKLSFLVILITSVIGLTFSSAPALADGTTQVSAIQFVQGSFTTSATSTDVASLHGAATLNGKIEVKFMMPHGIPQSWRNHCTTGDFAWSDWQISSGGVVWAPPGHHGTTHACFHNGKWYQIGGGPGQWNCGNVVMPIHIPLPPKAVKVKMSQIVVVKRFTYTVTVKVKATASQTDSATASCQVNGAMASSSVHATGYGYAYAMATARASSRSSAIAKATAGAISIVSRSKSTSFVSAQADVVLKLNGQATALCVSLAPPPQTCPPGTTGTPPNCSTPMCPPGTTGTPPNCQPTITAKPPTVALNSVQEVDTDGTDVIKATVSAPQGDSLKVCFSAQFGSFAPSCVNTTSTSSTPVQSTYTAPSEPLTETVRVVVYDLTTGLDSSGQSDGNNVINFPVQKPSQPPV